MLGLSVLSWAVFGLTLTTETRPVLIRTSIAALHLVVAVLILIRSRVEQNGSMRACLLAIPGMIIAGWALRIAPAVWSLTAQAVFFAGVCIAIVSFVYLGRCFAIMPAFRGVVTGGPYRILRHPAYFGELMLVLGCCLAAQRIYHLGPIVVAVPLIALRILAEERVMSRSAVYEKYKTKVRWRLIPLVW